MLQRPVHDNFLKLVEDHLVHRAGVALGLERQEHAALVGALRVRQRQNDVLVRGHLCDGLGGAGIRDDGVRHRVRGLVVEQSLVVLGRVERTRGWGLTPRHSRVLPAVEVGPLRVQLDGFLHRQALQGALVDHHLEHHMHIGVHRLVVGVLADTGQQVEQRHLVAPVQRALARADGRIADVLHDGGVGAPRHRSLHTGDEGCKGAVGHVRSPVSGLARLLRYP